MIVDICKRNFRKKQYRKYSAVNKVKFSKSFLLIKFLLTFYVAKNRKKIKSKGTRKTRMMHIYHKSFWDPKVGHRPHAFIASHCCLTMSANSVGSYMYVHYICTHTYKERFSPLEGYLYEERLAFNYFKNNIKRYQEN